MLSFEGNILQILLVRGGDLFVEHILARRTKFPLYTVAPKSISSLYYKEIFFIRKTDFNESLYARRVQWSIYRKIFCLREISLRK